MTTQALRRRTEQDWLKVISLHSWENPRLFNRCVAIIWWDYVEYIRPAPTMRQIIDTAYGRLGGDALDRAIDVPPSEVEQCLVKCGYRSDIAHERARIKTWQTEKLVRLAPVKRSSMANTLKELGIL